MYLQDCSLFADEPLEPGSTPKLEALWITLINAATFVHACKLEGFMTFSLDLASPELSGCATYTFKTYNLVDLLDIPKDYHARIGGTI